MSYPIFVSRDTLRWASRAGGEESPSIYTVILKACVMGFIKFTINLRYVNYFFCVLLPNAQTKGFVAAVRKSTFASWIIHHLGKLLNTLLTLQTKGNTSTLVATYVTY